MLIILFGLAGSGKGFVGKTLAKHFGYCFWDADERLTTEMQDCIRHKKSFTQVMRDEFTKIMIEKIIDLNKMYSNLAVSQALYKEKNRVELQKQFPEALFIYVTSDPKMISARLKSRNDWVDEQYAEKIAKNFEMPILPHSILINNNDEKEIIEQLNKLMEIK